MSGIQRNSSGPTSPASATADGRASDTRQATESTFTQVREQSGASPRRTNSPPSRPPSRSSSLNRSAGRQTPAPFDSAIAALSAGWGDKALTAVSATDFRVPNEPAQIMRAFQTFMTATQSDDPVKQGSGHLGMGRMLASMDSPIEGMPLNLGQMRMQAHGHLMMANNIPAKVTKPLMDAVTAGTVTQEQAAQEWPKVHEQASRMRGAAGLSLGNLMGNATPRIFMNSALQSPDPGTRGAAQSFIADRQAELAAKQAAGEQIPEGHPLLGYSAP